MSQKIQELSDEALRRRKKTTEVVSGVLAGMLTILLVMAVILCMKNKLSVGLPLLVIPFALSPIVFITVADVRAVKKELQTRH